MINDGAPSLRVVMTGTLITPDGSDTNAYGEGCEPGYGYKECSGWVDPDWTPFEVYPNQSDVRPDVWSPDDGPMIEWLVGRIRERIGFPEETSGYGTFYGADAQTDSRTGRSIVLAAHVKDCPPSVLAAAEYLLAHEYETAQR